MIDSDGRAGAPRTVAAAWTGSAVRFVQLDAAGSQVLRIGDPAGGAVPPPAAAEPGAPDLVAVAGGDLRAWVDPAQPRGCCSSRRGGAAPRGGVPARGGRPRLGRSGLVAVLSRAGGGLAVTRVDIGGGPPRPRLAWTGTRAPAVAVGEGTLAIADGRRVLASRRGGPGTRTVTTAGRRVDAIGADGGRLAWVERGRKRGLRVGIVRLARLR